MAAVAESGSSYVEIRRKRIQENLKQLEELGISKISEGLLEVVQRERAAKCHTSPKPKRKIEVSELRRSSRARNPIISYSDEAFVKETVRFYKRRSTSSNPDRAYTGRVASYKQTLAAQQRAEALQKDLNASNPSFVKTMVRSHVSSCFWLGLPGGFCKDYLPPNELRMVLEDEESEEYDAVYIGKRTGLSGGWRGFALDHNLEDGDALLFELVKPDRFKIYIIKAIQEETRRIDNGEATTSNAGDNDTPVSPTQLPETEMSNHPKNSGEGKEGQKVTKRKRKN